MNPTGKYAMRWAGVVAAILALAAGIGAGGSVGVFVNLPGLLFVLLVGGGVTVAAHGARPVVLMLRAALIGIRDEDAAIVRAASETGIQGFVAAGWIGVIVGVVQMLSTLDDPSRLGRGGAVALLTALYGYILAYLFCMPLARSLSVRDRAK